MSLPSHLVRAEPGHNLKSNRNQYMIPQTAIFIIFFPIVQPARFALVCPHWARPNRPAAVRGYVVSLPHTMSRPSVCMLYSVEPCYREAAPELYSPCEPPPDNIFTWLPLKKTMLCTSHWRPLALLAFFAGNDVHPDIALIVSILVCNTGERSHAKPNISDLLVINTF